MRVKNILPDTFLVYLEGEWGADGVYDLEKLLVNTVLILNCMT